MEYSGTAIIGAAWGDEGKGDSVDQAAADHDIVVRFQGGKNAGHVLDGKYAVRQIPAGVRHSHCLLYDGMGMTLDLPALLAEKKEMEQYGFHLKDRLFIAGLAVVVQPSQIYDDNIHGGGIGTTGNGIGPAYAARALRRQGDRLCDLRVADLVEDPQFAREVMQENFRYVQSLYGAEPNPKIPSINSIIEAAAELSEHIVLDPTWLATKAKNGSRILFEGGQGTRLDNIFGTRPYSTGSNTIAAAAYVGSGLPITYPIKVIGVTKALETRVGNGPFPSEFGGRRSELYCDEKDENGKPKHTKEFETQNYQPSTLLQSDNPFLLGVGLRMVGNEYGTNTKRPRRLGALDLSYLEETVTLNGMSEVYIRKFDQLKVFAGSSLPGIPLVVGHKINGKMVDCVPTSEKRLREVEPIIEYAEPFSEDLAEMRNHDELPRQVKDLIRRISSAIDCPVTKIGVGPRSEQTIPIPH